MDIVKKNIVSILLGVVALILVIAAFFPLGGYAEELQTKLDARRTEYNQMRSLLDKQRNLPVLAPGAEPLPLGRFPNERVIEVGRTTIQKVEEESLEMYHQAVQLNQEGKQLLVPGSLPNPVSTVSWEFRREYADYFPADGDMTKSRFYKMLNASGPLDTTVIERAQTEAEAKIRDEQEVRLDDGTVYNESEVATAVAERLEEIPEELRAQLAQDHMIYVEHDVFDRNANIAGDTQLNPLDIWWAQVGLWLQEEIVHGLNAANRGATNILDAPVKHVKDLQFLPQFITASATTGTDPAAEITEDYNFSPTGRVSNGMYDVMHFDMTVVVEVEDIPAFIKGMAENRFINIIHVESANSVDAAAAMAQGYLYGEKEVMELDVKGEVLFMREWTKPFMPEVIKRELGLAEAAAPAQ